MESTKLPEPQSRPPVALFWSTSLGTLAGGMNSTIVSTVLPAMVGYFHVSYDLGQWLVSIYTLVLAVLVLPVGRLSDLVGHLRVFRWGVLGFGAASLAAGMATNFPLLLAVRAVQAVGGAMVMTAVPALLSVVYPPEQRGRVLGLYAMNVYIGYSLGPLIGGALVHATSWRAVFLLNLPLAGVAWWWSGKTIPPRVTRRVALDWLGATLFSLAMAALLVAVGQTAEAPLAWRLSLLGLAAAMGTAFVAVERKATHPMLALSLLRHRTVALGSLAVLCNYTAMFFFYLLVPLWLNQVGHLPLNWVGLMVTATPVTMVVVSRLSGQWSDRVGTRTPMALGLALLAVGLGWIGHDSPLPWWNLLPAFVLVGVGIGLFTAPAQSAVLGATPRPQQGMTSGLLGTVRYGGQALGTTLAAAIFSAALAVTHTLASAFIPTMSLGALVALAGAWAAWASQPPRRA